MIFILFFSFFVFLILGVPIAFSIGLSSVAALVFGDASLLIILQKMYSGINTFPIMAIPLFLLAGNIMAEAKISVRLVDLASMLVGRFTGGLANVSTAAAAFFGSISGSSPATTAAIGSVMIPSMKEKGYEGSYASAVVASSGVLGLIIPPSLTMVIYGVTAGVSIGDLFLAGIIPGILITISLIILNYFMAKKYNYPKEQPINGKEALRVVKRSLLALLMPIIILGGIYTGIFTPTESAAVACVYALIIGVFVYRNLNFENLFKVLKNTAESTAMIMFLLATASIFSFLIASEQVPQKLSALLFGVSSNQFIIMLIILIGLMIIGTFLDNVAAIILVVPTLMEVVHKVGIDPIYFGIFMVFALAVGNVTPPVGLNLFIAANIADVKIESISVKVIPFVLVFLGLLVLFIFVPQIIIIP